MRSRYFVLLTLWARLVLRGWRSLEIYDLTFGSSFFLLFLANRMTLLDLGADEGNTLSESFELSGKVK